MSAPLTPQSAPKFIDPRRLDDFDPRHYPRLNGQPAPAPLAAGRNDRIKLAFLAAYYDLNQAHDRLMALRATPDFDGRRAEETPLLQEIERRLIERDQLEDEFAPFGVIAQPLVEDGCTVDLVMSFGNEDRAGRLRSDGYTISAYVPIPCPAGISLEDVAIRIEGPCLPQF